MTLSNSQPVAQEVVQLPPLTELPRHKKIIGAALTCLSCDLNNIWNRLRVKMQTKLTNQSWQSFISISDRWNKWWRKRTVIIHTMRKLSSVRFLTASCIRLASSFSLEFHAADRTLLIRCVSPKESGRVPSLDSLDEDWVPNRVKDGGHRHRDWRTFLCSKDGSDGKCVRKGTISSTCLLVLSRPHAFVEHSL